MPAPGPKAISHRPIGPVQPPAYWARIAEVRQAVRLPLVANGEIWNAEDARRCQNESGCTDLMLGRGMVSDPGLAWSILAAGHDTPWAVLVPLLGHFWHQVCQHIEPKARAGRLKQWLNHLRRRHPQAETAYQALRTERDSRAIEAWLKDIGTGPAVVLTGQMVHQ